ncbi:hypothetical protein KC19_4G061500 [Ceratodon purpureus]|uniref:PSI-K n=1 Tax=Ceratodon purpureus TaxID=3225 RepID=A0A8T0I671_CERPU|nr:hypothetical protein KC19_4G061500 [Ceratodon purpureus]
MAIGGGPRPYPHRYLHISHGFRKSILLSPTRASTQSSYCPLCLHFGIPPSSSSSPLPTNSSSTFNSLSRSTMAAMAATMSVTASVRQFEGLKATTSFTKPLPSLVMRKTAGKGALGARCDYIGSSTNLIMIASTTAMLFAGRFGLAPSANRMSTAGLKLVDRDSGLQTGDPAGFTATDTLACGAMGHVFGVGIVLGLKAIGSL